MYYSPDGKSWLSTLYATSNNTSINLSYVGAKFLFSISATTSTVAHSSDGITWTNTTLVMNTGTGKPAFDGTNYYVAGSAGKVARTTDFSSWTITTPSNSTHTYVAAAFGNGTLVLAGNDGVIVTSTNSGSTATIRTSGATAVINDVVWDSVNSVFIAVTRGAGPIVITSPDGITWTDRTPSGYNGDTRGLATSNGVTIGIQSSNTSHVYSTDGTTWTRYNPLLENILQIAANSTEFIGYTGTGANNKYFAISPTKSKLLFQKISVNTAS
jgi:hypothetical protein